MKKIIGILSVFLSTGCFSQPVDYSQGNTNPYANYNYTPPQQNWQDKKSNINKEEPIGSYFDQGMQNPTSIQPVNPASCWDKAAYVYKLDP